METAHTAETADARLAHAEEALRHGHAREALELARGILTLEPHHSRALAMLGLAHAYMGDPEEAHDCLQRAIDLAPLEARVRYYAYAAHAHLRNLEGARMELTYFTQLEPENVPARGMLARMGGPPENLPPLPRPAGVAVWFDAGGHALADAGDILEEAEGVEPPPGPGVMNCPGCQKRTWKGIVCKHCGALLAGA